LATSSATSAPTVGENEIVKAIEKTPLNTSAWQESGSDKDPLCWYSGDMLLDLARKQALKMEIKKIV